MTVARPGDKTLSHRETTLHENAITIYLAASFFPLFFSFFEFLHRLKIQKLPGQVEVLDLGTELNFTAGVSYAIKRGHIIDAAEKYLIYEAGHESSKASVLNLYQALTCCSYFGKVLNHVAAESGLWG